MKSQRIVHRIPGLLAAVAVASYAMGACPAIAQTSGATKAETASNRVLIERIDALEKELKDLKKDTRVLEVSDEARTKAKPVAGYQDGFFLNSPDGKFKLKVGGYAQADTRFATDESENPTVNTFQIRRARLDIRGTLWDRYDFRIQPDFGGSSVTLQDAYLDTRFAPWAVLRSGKYKTPYGLERLQTDSNSEFIELSLVSNLVPNRDVGFQLGGDVHQGEFTYQFAVLNGVPDGSNGDIDVNDGVDVALRVFSKPFVNTSIVPLRGLGVGTAGTWGKEQGTASSPQLPQFKTSSQNTYFKYSADNPATPAGTTVANGPHWRASPQAYYYFGPFSTMFEYAFSNQDLLKATAPTPTKGNTTNTAWQIRATYLLTGEDATYDVVVPKNNFDFGGGGWGAWEIALRYANLDVDNDTFKKGFSDPTKWVSQINSVTAGLNWYLNKNIKWEFNYENSTFSRGVKVGNRDPENVFLSRVQFLF